MGEWEYEMTIAEKLEKAHEQGINGLYGSEDAYTLFERSFLVFIVLDGNDVIGAARVISEGVETALFVDLKAKGDLKDVTETEIKTGLIKAAEKHLSGRRVMVYGRREDLDLYEKLGYGRCKNAWTYFRKGFDEKDFLPSGFRYENEFFSQAQHGDTDKAVVSAKDRMCRELILGRVTYKNDISGTTYEAVNDILTRAFWGHPHDVEKTKAAFSNSRFTAAAFDGERLIGVARAVADTGNKDDKRIDGKYATILNVAVDPEYQGLSVGKNLVLRLSEIIPAETIVLNTHPGAVGFYNRIREYRRNLYVFEKHIHEGEKREMPPEMRIGMFTPKGFRFPSEYVQ